MAEELLTVTETAARLKVSRATVFRLLRDGELQRLKVRGVTRISTYDIAQYLCRDFTGSNPGE